MKTQSNFYKSIVILSILAGANALALTNVVIKSRVSTNLFALTPGDTETERSRKKMKKNKYSKFSKTDNLKLDPFEALLSESEKKKKQLEGDISKKENQFYVSEEFSEGGRDDKRERNKRLFPDNKTIDPYDPTTYGYTELGTILGPHGVYGLLKIASVTDFPERLCKPGVRQLKAPNRRTPRETRLLEGRHRLKNEYLIKLEGISDRNEAMKLRGFVLYARQEERPEDLEDDEYLISDLVGLDVRLVTGYGEDDVEDEYMKDSVEDVLESSYPQNEDDDENKRTVTGENSVSGKFVGTVGGVVLAEEMCSIPGLGQDLLEVILPRGRLGIPSWRDEMVLIPLVPSIVPTIDIERRILYIDPPSGLLDLTYVKEENVRIKGFLPEVSSYEKNRNK